MTAMDQFIASLKREAPDQTFSAPLAALWWEAKGDWHRAHALVDDLETREGMAVHAYLHRKEGASANADYWYRRAGSSTRRLTSEEEWSNLANSLLADVRGEASAR